MQAPWSWRCSRDSGWDGQMASSHFTDQQTEALGGGVARPRPHGW